MRPVHPEGFPAHWTSTPLWSMYRRVSRGHDGNEPHLSVYRELGVVAREGRTDNHNVVSEDSSNYQLVLPGDLVVNKMKAWQGSMGVSRIRGVVSPAYFVYEPLHQMNPRFMHYLLRSRPFIDAYGRMSKGVRIGQWDLDPWAFSRVPITLPSENDQTRISDLLDRELVMIDAIIEKQRALINGLRMRRESTVRDAFSAPKADTNARVIPHLGAVPSSWTVRPLWSLYRREKRVGYTDELMVSVFREHGVVYKDDHANLNVTAEDRSIYQLVEPGWLVVNRMKAWQGSVGVSALRGISSGHYLCFRPLEDLHHPFMNWLFRSPQYRDWFAAHSRGVRPGQAEIDNEHLKSAPVVLPPHKEQQRIADHLDRETARIDVLITRSERLIELSHERRSALITAAVTGQLDITTNAMALEGAA